MIKKSLVMVVAVLVSAAVGCGAEDMGGMGMLQTDAGAAVDTLPGMGGATGTTGGTLGTASDAGNGLGGSGGASTGGAAGSGGQGQGGAMSGTGGAQATGGVTGTGGAVGTGGTGGMAEVAFCSSATRPSVGGCGFLITAGQWEYLWKGDLACGSCTLNSKPVVGCKTPTPAGTTSSPTPPDILCVADCRAECCFKRAGASCTTDANCCSPMHCMDNGPGKGKTCR